jgi:ribose-phosphate pyrophosphokinase
MSTEKPEDPVTGHRDISKRVNDERLPLLFACASDLIFARAVAHHLHISVSPLEENDFEDGEQKVRPMVEVEGRDVYVIAGLHGGPDRSVHDCLCRLLFLIGGLKTNGAARVTVITPYLCYLRKDRQTKDRDPLTGRYVAQLLEAIGTDRVVVIEPHNLAALQNAFRIPTITLNAYARMAQYYAEQIGDEQVAVISPDIGGAKRAELFREQLEKLLGRPVARGLMDKKRSMGTIRGDLFAGEVKDRHVIIIDDLISSGSTVLRVAKVCQTKGAKAVHVVATHGLFHQGAADNLADPSISTILITNSAWPVVLPQEVIGKLGVLDVSSLFADRIGELSGLLSCLPDTPYVGPAQDKFQVETHAHHPIEKVEVLIPSCNVAGFLQIPHNLRGLVIFAHGSASNRHSRHNLYIADALLEDGFATLLIDLLQRDELKDRRNIFDINLLSSRLIDVIDWIATQPRLSSLPMGLLGASTGSTATFYAASVRPVVKALVSIAGRPDLATGVLEEVQTPTQLIVGGLDTEVLRLNEAGMEDLGGIKNLEIIPAVAHFFSEPGALEVVAELSREWFDRYLEVGSGDSRA